MHRSLLSVLVIYWLLAGSVCLLASGCGGSGRLKTVPVSGRVLLDGEPLSLGTVVFTPANGQAAAGKIQSDGSFTLGTYEESDGAILGRHQVAVMAHKELSEDSPGAPGISRFGPSLIPEFYSDSATSGLSFEVTDDGKNVFDIRLSSQARAKK